MFKHDTLKSWKNTVPHAAQTCVFPIRLASAYQPLCNATTYKQVSVTCSTVWARRYGCGCTLEYWIFSLAFHLQIFGASYFAISNFAGGYRSDSSEIRRKWWCLWHEKLLPTNLRFRNSRHGLWFDLSLHNLKRANLQNLRNEDLYNTMTGNWCKTFTLELETATLLQRNRAGTQMATTNAFFCPCEFCPISGISVQIHAIESMIFNMIMYRYVSIFMVLQWYIFIYAFNSIIGSM